MGNTETAFENFDKEVDEFFKLKGMALAYYDMKLEKEAESSLSQFIEKFGGSCEIIGLDSTLTEKEFLESINYHESWKFPWHHYKQFFDYAIAYNTAKSSG